MPAPTPAPPESRSRRVVVIVESDPATSARPAEALRIAAGLAAWRDVRLFLYLRGPAAGLLGERTDDLIEGDRFGSYLTTLVDAGGEIWVDPAAGAAVPAAPPVPFRPSDPKALAGLLADSHTAFRF